MRLTDMREQFGPSHFPVLDKASDGFLSDRIAVVKSLLPNAEIKLVLHDMAGEWFIAVYGVEGEGLVVHESIVALGVVQDELPMAALLVWKSAQLDAAVDALQVTIDHATGHSPTPLKLAPEDQGVETVVPPSTSGIESTLPGLSGCSECSSDDAETAYGANRNGPGKVVLVDESHHRISVDVCPACGQRWVVMMCEEIDWQRGEDPIFRSMVPVTADEAKSLIAMGAWASQPDVIRLSAGRRVILMEHPSDQPLSHRWAVGPIRFRTHD